jgi:hypothetical protein
MAGRAQSLSQRTAGLGAARHLSCEVKEIDDELTSKQTGESPLKRQYFHPLWKPLGPSDAVGGTNMGRVNCIEFDPKNAKIIYLCGADGGIWKSTNSGAT